MAWLVNVVVAAHIGIFVYLAGGFVLLIEGAVRRRPWIHRPWFRISHFALVTYVLMEYLFNLTCPLNVAETSLRETGSYAAQPPGALDRFLNWALHGILSDQTLEATYWAIFAVSLVLLFLKPPRFGFRPNHRNSLPANSTR